MADFPPSCGGWCCSFREQDPAHGPEAGFVATSGDKGLAEQDSLEVEWIVKTLPLRCSRGAEAREQMKLDRQVRKRSQESGFQKVHCG